MNIVGLITEYNPFHNGHKYHIKEAKRITGADYVVVVMSGNFVQRGAPAITDKYTRTKMALSCGADLVIEIPTHYATASAEYFAYGSVELLHSLGFITHICFGSECGDTALLHSIASLLIEEPAAYQEALQGYLKQGLTFPVARNLALKDYLLQTNHFLDTALIEEVLASPNNILGIEYIKALHQLSSTIKPVAIQRIANQYHDTTITHAISSASAIRKAFANAQGVSDLASTIPTAAFCHFEQAYNKTSPVVEDDFSTLLYYKLLQTSDVTLSTYLDSNQELGKRIKFYLSDYRTYSQFVQRINSKNVTQTRVQRVLLHILLEIKSDLFDCNDETTPNYIRILGMKKSASVLLKKSTLENTLPIITKVGDAKSLLNPRQQLAFDLDVNSAHLYNQVVYQKFGTVIRDEYRHGVIFTN